MKEKRPTTETFDQWEAWAQRTYRTGETQPPKSHGGLIAFLLVLVIFLGGIASMLGLMNIRLTQQLATLLPQEETLPVAFSRNPEAEHTAFDNPLGFAGQEVSPFWQNYHNLPSGIYITKVQADSDASAKGVLPGDILVEIDGIPIPDQATLQQVLVNYSSGDSVCVTLNRGAQTVTVILILE